ncbi:MAG: hypothetical protein K2Q25_03600 [Mycobacteriaceae bacterium]|nr:hypothetical protein [Mycobacteriaceae bacterium]
MFPTAVRRNALAESFKRQPANPISALLAGAISFAGLMLSICYLNGDFDDSSATNKKTTEKDPENEFAVSGNHFLNAQQKFQEIAGTSAGWVSDSQARYGDQTTAFSGLLGQVAKTNQQVNTTVQTEAQQVNNDKETLGNILTGLHLAIPVAESLYFSGPAGPALSYHFQLATANSAVSTGTDTANTMHENSATHAEKLTELLETYNTALESVPPAAPISTVGAH